MTRKDEIQRLLSQFLILAKATPGADVANLINDWAVRIAREEPTVGRLLREKEVSRVYPVLDVKRLQNWRARGEGPPYIKMGTARQSPVYYRQVILDRWLLDQEVR